MPLIKHKLSTSNFYIVYHNMIQRCYNSNNPIYKNYGKLGVTVASEWIESFETFKDDMYDSYIDSKKKYGKVNLDKDKICLEKGIYPHIYSKETCLWLTPKENNQYHYADLCKQVDDRRRITIGITRKIIKYKRVKYMFRGEHYTMKDFSKKVKITLEGVRLNLLKGKTLEDIYIKHKLDFTN